MKRLLITIIFSGVLLSACSKEASHLPSIFDLPGAAGSVIENAAYHSKRKKVSHYVSKHYLALRSDVSKGGGQSLEGVFDVANIKHSKRASAIEMLRKGQKETFYNAMLVSDVLINPFAALYVHQSSPKDKRINGFTYLEARMIIQNFADSNFEGLRQSIKQGQGKSLDQLLLKLNIKDAQKQASFRKKAYALYHTIYLEPVTVAIMVNS